MARCDRCLWFDQCRANGYCSDFSPADEDYDKILEEKRREFELEWKKYMRIMDD